MADITLMPVLMWPGRERILSGENDYISFYAGARLLGTPGLYDPAKTRDLQLELIGTTGEARSYLIRLPWFAALLWPICQLPYILMQSGSCWHFWLQQVSPICGGHRWARLFRRVVTPGLSVPVFSTGRMPSCCCFGSLAPHLGNLEQREISIFPQLRRRLAPIETKTNLTCRSLTYRGQRTVLTKRPLWGPGTHLSPCTFNFQSTISATAGAFWRVRSLQYPQTHMACQ